MKVASITVCLLAAVSAFGQPGPPPAFSAADVHTVDRNANPVLPGALSGTSRFELHGATMIDLIGFAWNVEAGRVAGGPNWLATDRFLEVIASAPGPVTRDESAAMLRALLAERFKLVVHNDTRPIQAFAMTVAKGGVRMKKSDGPVTGNAQGSCTQQTDSGIAQDGPPVNTFVCRAMTMPAFAERLPGNGGFYFSATVWSWIRLASKERGTSPSGLRREDRAPRRKEQLPCSTRRKSNSGRTLSPPVPVPVIVVDSVNEKPTDNAPGVSEKLKTKESEFEVALLKPGAPGATQMRVSLQGGKVDVQSATLRTLITVSWNLTNDKIVGLPDFADTD